MKLLGLVLSCVVGLATSCSTYNGDLYITSKDFVANWAHCIINGNVIVTEWDQGSDANFDKIQEIDGSLVIRNCNGEQTEIPFFNNLKEIRGNKAADVYTRSCKFAESSASGLIINFNNGVKRIWAGDGRSTNNKRFPYFPVLTLVKDIHVESNWILAYFDTNIMPNLNHITGDFFIKNPRYITVSRFFRVLKFDGSFIPNNVEILNEYTCSDRGLVTYDNSGSDNNDKRKLIACVCAGSAGFVAAGGSFYSKKFLDYQNPDINGRRWLYPRGGQCQDCTPCLDTHVQASCGHFFNLRCDDRGGGTPFIDRTTAPTYTTTSPTVLLDGRKGTFTGPDWNRNMTKEAFLLFDTGYKGTQMTEFRLWFKAEHDVPRNGYFDLEIPPLIAQIWTVWHPICYLYVDWHQNIMGENVINEFDVHIIGIKTVRFVVGDQGVKQELTNMIHCWKIDTDSDPSFKFIGNSITEPGEHMTTKFTSYSPDGTVIDHTSIVDIPVW